MPFNMWDFLSGASGLWVLGFRRSGLGNWSSVQLEIPRKALPEESIPCQVDHKHKLLSKMPLNRCHPQADGLRF